MSSYYIPTGNPAPQSRASSATDRAEFAAIGAGFAMLPPATALYGGSANYAVDSGAPNAYVVAENPAITTYADGLEIVFKAANANTGASTVNVNGLGLAAITRANGAPLLANDIFAGQFVSLRYNAITGTFVYSETAASVNAAQALASAQFTTAFPNVTGQPIGSVPAVTAPGVVGWTQIQNDLPLMALGII